MLSMLIMVGESKVLDFWQRYIRMLIQIGTSLMQSIYAYRRVASAQTSI